MNEQLLDDGSLFQDNRIHDAKTNKEINLLKIDANELITSIKAGRTAMIVLSVLSALTYAYIIYMGSENLSGTEVIIVFSAICIIYLLCALFITKNAKVSLGIGLGIYLLLKILDFIADPASIFSGIIVAFAIIYFLVKALLAAIKLDKVNKRLHTLGVSRDEIQNSKELVDYVRSSYDTID